MRGTGVGKRKAAGARGGLQPIWVGGAGRQIRAKEVEADAECGGPDFSPDENGAPCTY